MAESPSPKPKTPKSSPKKATPAVAAAPATVETAPPTKAPLSRKTLAMRILLPLVTLVILAIIVFGMLIYGFHSESDAVRVVSGVVPYPAMKVNGDFVSYHEYLFDLNSYEQYYQSQSAASGQPAINFKSASGKTQLAQLRQAIIGQLKSDEVVRQLVKQNKITVSTKDLNDQYSKLVSSAGGEAKLKDVLSKVYGWTPNDLKNKLKFQLEEQALQTKLMADPAANTAAKNKADDLLKQLQGGADFATLAKKYSQDSSASAGGDLGSFTKSQLPTSFPTTAATAVFALPAGGLSNVIKSQYGYQIFKVNTVNGDQIDASEILIQPIDFNSYLNGKVNGAKVHTYIKV